MESEKTEQFKAVVREPGEIPTGHHLVEAHNWIEAADQEGTKGYHGAATAFAAIAQARASLAIAEQLGRIGDLLEAATDPPVPQQRHGRNAASRIDRDRADSNRGG